MLFSQTFDHFQILNKMGAVCESVPITTFPHLEETQSVLLTRYAPCEWPEDAQFRDRIDQLRKKQGYEEFIACKTLKKHKDQDQYYLGQWDQGESPKGQGFLYRPGQIFYEGSFDSVPHGNGVLDDLKNEVIYDGEFVHGKIEGQGTFRHYHNHFIYEGTISSDSHPITGKLVVNNQEDSSKSFTVLFNNYPSMKARVEYRDSREYEGYLNLKTFVPEGEGTSTYPNNSIYEGNWLSGEFHGQGKFTWPDGSQYVGDYHEGKKHGHGRFTYPSKKVYDGAWVNGKQDGEGKLFDQTGDLLKKGAWSEGLFVKGEL